MTSRSFTIAPIRCPMYLLLLLASLFLFQSPRPVQSISLSRLCGQFGHSCFGANWGKRAAIDQTLPEYLLTDLKTNNDATTLSSTIDDILVKNYVLEELRLKLLRQRLRQVLGLE